MRWLSAVLLVACAALSGYAAWFSLSLRHAVSSLIDRLGESGALVVAWDVGRLQAAYWSVLVFLAVVLVAALSRRRLGSAAASAVLLLVAAATVPISPLPLSGGFVTGGTTVSVTAAPSWAIAAGCWVAVGLGALVLAVTTWRVQPSGARPRP